MDGYLQVSPSNPEVTENGRKTRLPLIVFMSSSGRREWRDGHSHSCCCCCSLILSPFHSALCSNQWFETAKLFCVAEDDEHEDCCPLVFSSFQLSQTEPAIHSSKNQCSSKPVMEREGKTLKGKLLSISTFPSFFSLSKGTFLCPRSWSQKRGEWMSSSKWSFEDKRFPKSEQFFTCSVLCYPQKL